MPVPWEPVELSFVGDDRPAEPYTTEQINVQFEHDSGTTYRIPGFWDGETTYRVRFAPTKPGHWEWTAEGAAPGLSGEGEIEVRLAERAAPLHTHGYLRAKDRKLVHADGTPCFWLADTAWAASTRATTDEWKRYLDARVEQGFNVVQVNALRQHDGSRPHPRLPFGDSWNLTRPDHEYFRHLDRLVEMAHARGAVTALVALWFDYAPGANVDWVPAERRHEHPPELARALGRYLGARYGAYGVAWLVSGDSYMNEKCLASYRAAGRALGRSCQFPLRTAHQPGGQVTPTILNDEAWLDFRMYQSGHTLDITRPAQQASQSRILEPTRPVINGEPCYAAMKTYASGSVIDRETVRAAGWMSVLSGANAGLTYGALGIWNWHRPGDTFEAADRWGEPAAWSNAVALESADDYARLATIVTSIQVERLDPRPQILAEREAGEVAAVTPEAVLVYLREGRSIQLRDAPPIENARWIDPATGKERTPTKTLDGRETGVEEPTFGGDALFIGYRSNRTLAEANANVGGREDIHQTNVS